MGDQVLVAGGGIGGLAAALAVLRSGWDVQVLEKAAVFSEVGAGVQLGPNVVRVLHDWGLAAALQAVAAFPDQLQVYSARSGDLLGAMRLGRDMATSYGAPYATVHRADLHGLLLGQLERAGAKLRLNASLQGFHQAPDGVVVNLQGDAALQGKMLIGADGLWSVVRRELLGDGPPRPTGHLAYRSLVRQTMLPEKLRTQNVTVWLGPRMHVVHYPVQRGEWLNIVAIVHAAPVADLQIWDHHAHSAELAVALGSSCTTLRDLVQAVPSWRLWVMHDRPPMQGAHQHAQGRVALLGDAAHPMRPYLAQGAGMAIEDAAELGRALKSATPQNVPTALQHYAAHRWQRNARVQARALRNGQIFHAIGPVRWGRDVAMKLMGERLLDMPWLYGYRPSF
jgi:salicylate hydroxylase